LAALKLKEHRRRKALHGRVKGFWGEERVGGKEENEEETWVTTLPGSAGM